MSLTKEDLQAIRAIIKEETDPINKRLNKIESDIEIIKEDVEITREATNEVLTWLDTYWRKDMDRPFPAKEKDVV